MEPIVRAVDVGFGNTKYVKSSRAGKVECAHFPSIAYDGAHDRTGDALGGSRRTVCVPVGGLWYEVGPDVELAAEGFVGRNHHDDFVRTPEYRAFVAGALHFMRVDRVDLLVLGLPVAQYMGRRTELARAMTGTFDLGRTRTVEVRQVLVVAQPQGALYDTLGHAGTEGAKEGKSLVIDAGSRTFDWLVTRDNRVIGKMSHSVNRGVHDMLIKIAAAVADEVGEDYRNLEAVDRALREKKPLRAYQRSFDLRRFDAMIQKIADQAVAEVHMRIGSTDDLEHIVLVGGGAHLFRAALRRKFPATRVSEVREPLYANVRGFQLIGEQYVREKVESFQDVAGSAPRVEDPPQPQALAASQAD
jgi:plasmid segregation protein ParM